jgi:hypothetical protein
MPRQARIDAPGALHHVIVRGIERCKIFRSGYDRQNFLKPAVSRLSRRGEKIVGEEFILLQEKKA